MIPDQSLQTPSRRVLRAMRISVTGFFFIQGLCFSSWASRIPDVKSLLHLNDAQLGNVLLSLPAGLMVSLPVSGWLVTRFGSKAMALTGMMLYAIILSALALASSVFALVSTLFVFGLVGNLSNISINTQAVQIEALYGRSIMSSFHGAWSIAGFTGAAVASLMISQGVNFHLHFHIMTMLVVALAILFQKRLFLTTVSEQRPPLFVKPDKVLLQLGAIAFLGMACEGAMFDWSGVYFKNIVRPLAALVPLGFTAFMATMATGRFLGDGLTNRTGRKRMLQISGVLIGCGLLLAVAFPNLPTAIAGFLLVGFGTSCVVPLIFAAAGRSQTMSPGMALAAVSSLAFFGFLLGPPVIGWIAQAASLRHSFALIACFGFGITLLTSFVKVDGLE